MKKEDVKKIASLARLSIDDSEIDFYLKDFENILAYISSIQEVEIPENLKVEETIKNIFREDENTIDDTEEGIEKLLSQAPEKKNGYFKVKKVL